MPRASLCSEGALSSGCVDTRPRSHVSTRRSRSIQIWSRRTSDERTREVHFEVPAGSVLPRGSLGCVTALETFTTEETHGEHGATQDARRSRRKTAGTCHRLQDAGLQEAAPQGAAEPGAGDSGDASFGASGLGASGLGASGLGSGASLARRCISSIAIPIIWCVMTRSRSLMNIPGASWAIAHGSRVFIR